MSELKLANDYIYDIEVYPNVFTLAVKSVQSGKRRTYEISPRKNEFAQIKKFMSRLEGRTARMVGFNNESFDYPVLHYMLDDLKDCKSWEYLCRKTYEKAQAIIDTDFNRRFAHCINDWKKIVPQIDLLKVHHFDNAAKATSLKMLEFNMRMKSIQDLPFPPGTVLTLEEIQVLVDYNDHDVDATFDFYMETLGMINFRESLSAKYDRNFLNHNDTKIGKDYFVMQLEAHLGKTACYHKVGGKRKAKQTKRDQIALEDVILDYVKFETAPFKAVKNWLDAQIIEETKGVFTELPLEEMLPFIRHTKLMDNKKVTDWLDNPDFLAPAPRVKKDDRRLSVMLDGVEFVFGTGGIHASVHNKRIESDEDHIIIDLDVTSYYPSLAIANRVFPEHLSEKFCDIYADMKAQRVNYPKGTPENAMLKLALNGVYGDSNNQYSPFFDPQYTMTITVNGQLLLCMLYEELRKIPSCELIQVNTDGLTVKVHRHWKGEVFRCKYEWEKMTGLELEEAFYDYMHIRDVNNYVAKYENSDSIKRKGAYEYKLGWYQNHSNLVVPKAAEAYIDKGTDIREFIENHTDDFDFLLRTKVPKTSRLVENWGMGLEEQLQNITRYYIAKDGPELVKIMPPLPKNPDKERRIGINIGNSIKECNEFNGVDRDLIDFDWYVKEAEKLAIFN